MLIMGITFFALNVSSGGSNRFQIVQFYSKGKDAGFKWSEISLLWKAAVLAEVDIPSKIYFSLDELDNCINVITRKYAVLDRTHQGDPAVKELVSKLFDYRKSVEFSKPRYKRGLKTTRDIPLNQVMKIRTSEAGIHSTTVCGNTDTYIVIQLSQGRGRTHGFHMARQGTEFLLLA